MTLPFGILDPVLLPALGAGSMLRAGDPTTFLAPGDAAACNCCLLLLGEGMADLEGEGGTEGILGVPQFLIGEDW